MVSGQASMAVALGSFTTLAADGGWGLGGWNGGWGGCRQKRVNESGSATWQAPLCPSYDEEFVPQSRRGRTRRCDIKGGAGAAQVLDTIFVSVASYRDLECHNTVADLFRQARPQQLDALTLT